MRFSRFLSILAFNLLTVSCGGTSAPGPSPAPASGATAIGAPAVGPPVTPAPAPVKTGVLVMAHGGSPEWNLQVDQALAPLRSRVPLALAFGMADRHTLQAGIDSLASRGVDRVSVVRMFLSGRSFEDQTLYLLGLSPVAPEVFLHHGAHGPSASPAAPPPISPAGVALATHRDGLMEWDGVSEILLDRAHTAGARPDRDPILVLGHGMGDEGENAEVVARIDHASTALRQAGFSEVVAETLREDWPEARAAAEERIRGWVQDRSTAGTPVVIPFRLSGFGPYAEVLEGLDYRPADGLLPHASIVDWVEVMSRQVACARGWTPPTGVCGT